PRAIPSFPTRRSSDLLRDMQFVLHEVMAAEQLLAAMPATAEVNRELMDAILDSAATMAEEVLTPLERTGDEEGCRWEEGRVATPDRKSTRLNSSHVKI